MHLMVVDLPQPDGPMRTTVSPALTWKLTPFRTGFRAKLFFSSQTSNKILSPSPDHLARTV